jgi:pimeloyl-ACP methyl ester carboxylesterase
LSFIVILIGLITIGAISESLAARRDPARHSPPGKLVDVGGFRLHLYCSGLGSPPVILESGLGDSSLVWADVQARLARGQRVCSYDRAGLGWSESGGADWSAIRAVQQLHSLLHQAGETPPYVLVGHSLGATYVRLYALTFPEEVQALILIEPPILESVPPAFITLMKAVRTGLDGLSRAGLIRLLGRAGLIKILYGGATPPMEISRSAGYLYRPESFQASIHEVEALPETVRAVYELSKPGALGDIPLLVISAHRGDNPPSQLVDALQDLAGLSSRSRVVFVRSSHFVHFDEPGTVAGYIEEIIAAGR